MRGGSWPCGYIFSPHQTAPLPWQWQPPFQSVPRGLQCRTRHREQLALLVTETGLFLSRYWGKNLGLGLRKRWPLWDSHSSPGRPTLQSWLHSHLSTCEDQRVTAVRAKSCKCAVKYDRFMFLEVFEMKVKRFSCVLTLFFSHLSSIKIRLGNVPERVTDAILEVNEVVAVDPHQVSAVEVQISFLQNIAESFPLSLFLVLDIANKRGNACDLWHQQSRLTFKKKKREKRISISHAQ